MKVISSEVQFSKSCELLKKNLSDLLESEDPYVVFEALEYFNHTVRPVAVYRLNLLADKRNNL